MRIVQIANFYTPTSGGLRTSLDEIGRGYGVAGHERILVVPGKADADEATPAGRRITVRSPKLLGGSNYHVLTGVRMHELLDELNPDVLEVSDKFSVAWLAPWARKRGVPLVLFSHERIDAILRSRVPRPLPLVKAADVANKRLFKRAEQVIVASNFAAAEFTRVGATNVHRIPLGVDLSVFRPPAAAEPGAGSATGPRPDNSAQSGGDVVRLVTVSRLSREKRAGRSIEVLRRLLASGVRAELTMVGDGPLRARMERRASRLPVRFTGHVHGREAVAELVAQADIALCPSPAETFGLAILEALACGTPVVVPRDGAARELISAPGSGIVSDGTATGMAQGVRTLLTVPAAERRAAARAVAERFPWSATVAGLLELYQDYGSGARAG